MVNETKEIEKANELEDKMLSTICETIRKYNELSAKHLAQITADLCGVDCEDLLHDTSHRTNSEARYLYWFAYRYLTEESYSSIAKKPWQRRFTEQCVGAAILRMANMISANTIWTKRWVILKHVIKGILEHKPKQSELFDDEVTIRIISPKNVHIQQIKQ